MQSAGHHALERKQQDEFVKQREQDEDQERDLPEKCMWEVKNEKPIRPIKWHHQFQSILHTVDLWPGPGF